MFIRLSIEQQFSLRWSPHNSCLIKSSLSKNQLHDGVNWSFDIQKTIQQQKRSTKGRQPRLIRINTFCKSIQSSLDTASSLLTLKGPFTTITGFVASVDQCQAADLHSPSYLSMYSWSFVTSSMHNLII